MRKQLQFLRYLIKISLLLIFSLWIIVPSVPLLGQECGPGCPVCSGSGRSTGALLQKGSLLSSFLYIPDGEEESGVMSLRAGINSWMDLGLGYTLKTEKAIWSVRLQPIKEDESSWKPAVMAGTGSVQTGGSDQSLFLYLTKSWEFSENFSARLSVGSAGLIPEMNKLYLLTTMTLTITDHWSPFVNYDGRNLHFGLSYIPFDWLFVGVLVLEARSPSVLIGTRWSLTKK